MHTELENALRDLEIHLQQPREDLGATLRYLKTTPLPFIACYREQLTISERFGYSCCFLHLVGQYDLALAVGLCMNQYMAFCISALPTAPGSALAHLQLGFLDMVRERRWLLAVSSFDDLIRSQHEAPQLTECSTQADGSYLCNGTKNFQSLISHADVLLFSARVDGGEIGLFYTTLQGRQGVDLGPLKFGAAMASADTRALHFNNLELPADQRVPSSAAAEALGLHEFTRVVFAAMSMAPYLGGAWRGLREAAQFLQGVHADGTALAAFDGYRLDLGRARAQYQVCLDLLERFELRLAQLNPENFGHWLAQEKPKLMALKRHVSCCCEQLVGQARKTIGTRALQPDHIINRLSQQVLFAALHPVMDAKTERELGERIFREIADWPGLSLSQAR